MKTQIIIPNELKSIISNVGNRTKQKSTYKIYNALVRKSRYKNKDGWFEVSSKYLKKINGQYSSIIKFLIDNDIIEQLTRIYQAGEQWGQLFESIEKVSYSAYHNKCINYRFKIDIMNGDTIEIDFEDPKTDKRWYKILKDSIERLGYDAKISRDNFGERVYHNLISSYKNDLHKKGYYVIDAITSQPRLLYLIMKERGIYDKNYFDIFENDKDFYTELQVRFNLESRCDAKDIFMFWALGNGYTKGIEMYKVFPNATKFLKGIKARNHKDASRYLSFRESRIFIDDLLQNLPVNFGITIHDSIIVRKNDAQKVLEYCKMKYPDLRFNMSEI